MVAGGLLVVAGCASAPEPAGSILAERAGPPAGAVDAGRNADATPAESPVALEPDSRSATGFVLGEGDLVRFTMYGQPEMETTAYVSAEGRISLPLIGPIQVGGMSPTKAADQAASAYESGGYFVNPQVNMTVEQYRSRQISVLGQVNKPGRYALETQTGVLDALAMAGGVMPSGANEITVIRRNGAGTERIPVNLRTVVQTGDGMTLLAGDVLYVPEARKFYIYGEVNRPDAYPMSPGMTVMQAISLGGGVTERGSPSRVEIRRQDASGRIRTYDPELTDLVQPDDVIYVKERFF